MKNIFTMVGVMGWPVHHSRSPIIHNYWIREHHLIGAYGLFPVAPQNLEAAIRGIQALGLAGCNITIPHKVEAMRCVDWASPLAHRIGAINTIVVQPDGALHGYNHDGFGYIQSLREASPNWTADDRAIVILGAGGAARAIIVGLIDEGATQIRLFNRTKEKSNEIAEEFGPHVIAYEWSERNESLSDAALLVNTTSLGMHGQATLDIDLSQLPTTAIVSDAIYIPFETPLLAAARERGNITVNGLGMLLHQARPAFQSWFSVMPDVTPLLRKAVTDTL